MYHYPGGKLDWLAAGLPTDGTNATRPRAGTLARRDVPTCRLDERLADVRDRARSQGWDAVVVVNEEGIVFGLLRSKELAQDGNLTIEQAMRPAPSTYRPYVLADEMAHVMVDHKSESAPVTTSDGKLVGLLLQRDVLEAHGKTT